MPATGLQPDVDAKPPTVTTDFIVSLPPSIWLAYQYVVLPQVPSGRRIKGRSGG